MKYFVFSTALFLFTATLYCQTKEETINWINSYSSDLLLDSKITISDEGDVEIKYYKSRTEYKIFKIAYFNLRNIYLPTKEDDVFESSDSYRMRITSPQEIIRINNTLYGDRDYSYEKYTSIAFKDEGGARRFSTAFIHLAKLFGSKPKPKKNLF